MAKLKEYPTDEDYFSDPRYWRNFLNRQKRHRRELERVIWQAIRKKDWSWLSNQIASLGFVQAQLKNWLLRECFGDAAYDIADRFDWGGKCPPRLRELIMNAECRIPRWQRQEALFIIDMYHEILQEASFFLEGRAWDDGEG